jgi:hypothetical protein
MIHSKKIKILFLSFSTVAIFAACKKEEAKTETITVTETVTQFSAAPVQPVTVLKAGTIVNETNQAGTTVGSLCIQKDANGCNFIVLNADFNSNFGTGTLAVYLAATNENIDTQRGEAGSAGNANILAAGFALGGGEQYYRLPANTSQGEVFDIENYNYVVFYCENASVNFGNAQLN